MSGRRRWRAVIACAVIIAGMRVAAEGGAVELPGNLTIAPALQPLVHQLLRRSETFRTQCGALAAASQVRVLLRMAPGRLPALVRARGRIVRRADGSIDATIEVPVSVDLPELIAHEMEHVLEQADRVDLPALARTRGADVTVDPEGVFETGRAKRAGLAAAGEWRAAALIK